MDNCSRDVRQPLPLGTQLALGSRNQCNCCSRNQPKNFQTGKKPRLLVPCRPGGSKMSRSLKKSDRDVMKLEGKISLQNWYTAVEVQFLTWQLYCHKFECNFKMFRVSVCDVLKFYLVVHCESYKMVHSFAPNKFLMNEINVSKVSITKLINELE